MLSGVDPSVLSSALKHSLPHRENLLAAQRRGVTQQQLGQFLREFNWREEVAQMFIVRCVILGWCMGS